MTTQALQDNHLFQTGYLVNGIWKTLDTTFDVLNPATGEVIARVAKAGKAETEDAIAAAAKAFPAWRAKTAKARSAILYRWYELIIENKSWLGRLMTTEQVKALFTAASAATLKFSGIKLLEINANANVSHRIAILRDGISEMKKATQ